MLDQNTAYIQTLIDRRNVGTYTVLLFSTFGLFWIYWIYLIANDLNKLNGIEWERKHWLYALTNPVGWGFLLVHIATGWQLLTGMDKYKTLSVSLILGLGLLAVIKLQLQLNRVWSGNQTYYWPPDFEDIN